MTNDSISALARALLSPTPAQVWTKAHYQDPENERQGFRKDDMGNWIHRDHYGKRDSDYGWEIDHIYPSSLGGHDGLSNVRPLHWRANCAKSDMRPGLLGLSDYLAKR